MLALRAQEVTTWHVSAHVLRHHPVEPGRSGADAQDILHACCTLCAADHAIYKATLLCLSCFDAQSIACVITEHCMQCCHAMLPWDSLPAVPSRVTCYSQRVVHKLTHLQVELGKRKEPEGSLPPPPRLGPQPPQPSSLPPPVMRPTPAPQAGAAPQSLPPPPVMAPRPQAPPQLPPPAQGPPQLAPPQMRPPAFGLPLPQRPPMMAAGLPPRPMVPGMPGAAPIRAPVADLL